MQKVQSNELSQCQTCDSNQWVINRQGNITCQNCGFVCSQGYITYEDEVFQDIENKKSLSRALISGGELNINKVGDETSKKLNQVDYHISLKFFEFLNAKEIYLEKNNFLKIWDAQSGDKNQADTKQFVYSYCVNEWRDFFDLDSFQNFQQTLKRTLNINQSKEIKPQPIDNNPTTEEYFYQLLKNIYPNLTELQFGMCLKRLNDVTNSQSCKRITGFCVTIYDLFATNFFDKKKISLDDIIHKVHQLFLYEKSQVNSNTVKRVHKLYLKQKSNASKSAVYSN